MKAILFTRYTAFVLCRALLAGFAAMSDLLQTRNSIRGNCRALIDGSLKDGFYLESWNRARAASFRGEPPISARRRA